MANTKFSDYINPVIDSIKSLGSSARPQEVYKYIARTLNLPDKILNEDKKSGGSRFENQVAWAKFFLAKAVL
ncbi:MAG: winged helix-turn-helix domain-containing protein [Smithella sp.]